MGGRTLIFCTSYLANPGVWAARFRPWCEHVAGLSIRREAVFIFDDASQDRTYEVGKAFADEFARV